MNNKDIKNLLKSELDSQIPDVLSRIDLNSIEILDKPKPRLIYALKQRIGSLALVMVASMMLIVALISLSNNNDTPVEVPMTLTAEKTVSFSAISSSALLDSMDIQLSTTNQMVLLSSMMQETKMKQNVSLLNPYFNMIELFISSNSDLEFTDPIPSSLPAYTYQVTYQIVNLNNDVASYVFHYNETTIDDELHTEGLLVLEQKQYYLEGVKVENGDQITITTKTYHDILFKDSHYVEFISNEIADLQWFEYTVYQDAEKVEKSTVHLEKVGETLRIRLKYENELKNIEVDLKAVRIEQNGVAKIRAEYEYEDASFEEEGNIVVSVVLDPINNTNQYLYEITNMKGEKDDVMGGRGHNDYGKEKDDNDDEEDEDDDHGRDDNHRP